MFLPKEKGPVSLAQFILCNLLNLQQHFDMFNTNYTVFHWTKLLCLLCVVNIQE